MSSEKIEQLLSKYEKQRIKLKDKRNTALPYLIATPLICLAFIVYMFQLTGGAIIASGVALFILTMLYYYFYIGADVETLVDKVKSALVEEYMSRYQPTLNYDYSANKQQGRTIISQSKLINFDHCSEEDVLHGTHENGRFYFSEITLKKDMGDDHDKTIFEGILFKLNLDNKNFPLSHIQGRPGLLSKLFGKYRHDEEHNFWYTTEDETSYLSNLSHLLPFIAHLNKSKGDLMIKTEGNEIIILISSKMKLLDEPEPGLSRSFLEEKYRYNIRAYEK